jgi:hypothetical protein
MLRIVLVCWRLVLEAEMVDGYVGAREAIMTTRNIKSAFRAAGLVPFNPNKVIECLPGSTLGNAHGLTPSSDARPVGLESSFSQVTSSPMQSSGVLRTANELFVQSNHRK